MNLEVQSSLWPDHVLLNLLPPPNNTKVSRIFPYTKDKTTNQILKEGLRENPSSFP